MTVKIDWVLVEGAAGARLGALGFLGDDVAAIALFAPGDSAGAVLTTAANRPEIRLRDPALGRLSRRVTAEFTRPAMPGQVWWQHLQSAPRMRKPAGAELIRPGEIARVLTRLGSEDALAAALA
ncbi:hypothetical protein [Paracoccus xiamenensis]|uniref:hypothetical protein n=1 Tax=Paracoccus xiamenensis TaxID=2714901 RepID=UPI00140BD9F4|nr:hypothetical protein [Paracoccus xiamenensis]NHF73863.1 hypothetical protein [Paracoccus xiamenensis]